MLKEKGRGRGRERQTTGSGQPTRSEVMPECDPQSWGNEVFASARELARVFARPAVAGRKGKHALSRARGARADLGASCGPEGVGERDFFPFARNRNPACQKPCQSPCRIHAKAPTIGGHTPHAQAALICCRAWISWEAVVTCARLRHRCPAVAGQARLPRRRCSH